MRVIIQRVSKASVSINNKVKSTIGNGLLILVGFEATDTTEDLIWMSKKICGLRIFEDKDGVMNLSVMDTGGEILIVSQFTLHAKTKKGNRPSYSYAAKPDIAIPLYNHFVETIEKDLGKKIGTGEFGAMMAIDLINQGPVTIFMDSKNKDL